jgi:Domain of unknown function (DUF4123)/Inner membrane component of T3SS, cytoplasmic domain
MRLILQIISGPHAGRESTSDDVPAIHAGRTNKSDLVTEDNFMSSRHFVIEREGKKWRLRDLNSRNGTSLNGKKVTEAILKNGDKIGAGHTEFLVRIEEKTVDSDLERQLQKTMPPPAGLPSPPVSPSRAQRRSKSGEIPRARTQPTSGFPGESGKEAQPAPIKKQTAPTAQPPEVEQPVSRKEAPKPYVERVQPPKQQPPPAVTPPPVAAPPLPPPAGMDPYTAATPEGRLFQLLNSQPEPLMALIDATDDLKVLDLLKASGEEYQSIYKDNTNAAIAPYLVSLPRNSALLKQLVHEGWGKGWGVYLTCRLPLRQLREYFRQSLMLTMPDGVELFSRFYDPAFFREFLENRTRAEAERFFGPISAYLMESEKPEILLEFRRTSEGVEKRGHLLSALE